MSENQAKLLELVCDDYTINEIQDITEKELSDLFDDLITILENQIQHNGPRKAGHLITASRILDKLNDIINCNTITKTKGIKRIQKCTKAIVARPQKDSDNIIYVSFLQYSLNKVKDNIKNMGLPRAYDQQYQAVDEIIFILRDFETTKGLFEVSDFNIKYASDTHLIFFLIDSYAHTLRTNGDPTMATYYRNTINYVLNTPKFQLTKEEKSQVVIELNKKIERIKRDKNTDHRKENAMHLKDILNKLTEKEVTIIIPQKTFLFTGQRQDLTGLYTITIDNSNTKIHDDALTIETLANGNFYLGIHIADPYGDNNAKPSINKTLIHSLRTEPDFNDPSIPIFNNSPFSGDLSLNKDNRRNTNSLFVEITREGHPINYKFVKGTIKVDENLTYAEVNKKISHLIYNEQLHDNLIDLMLVTGALKNHNQLKSIYKGLKIMSQDTKKRSKVSNQLTNVSHDYAQMIVEESMILYNHLLAEYFVNYQYPFIYKNKHTTEPLFTTNEEVIAVMDKLTNLGYPTEKIIKAFLALYPQTEYSTINRGNAALQLSSYCKATSPLRSENDIVPATMLELCYFRNPEIRTIHMLNDYNELIANYMTFRETKTIDPEIKEIKTYAKHHLNDIRKY